MVRPAIRREDGGPRGDVRSDGPAVRLVLLGCPEPPSAIATVHSDRKDGKLAELWRGPLTAAGEVGIFRIPSERADSGSCSAATGGRGEAGHLAKDPRCPLGHHRHGAV
jgi:hypothetical protein